MNHSNLTPVQRPAGDRHAAANPQLSAAFTASTNVWTQAQSISSLALTKAGSPQLQWQFNLGKHSVLKLLHDSGIELRRTSMTSFEIAEAVRLYESGLSLAKVGVVVGRRPSVVRDALARAGVTIRPSKGGR